MRLKFEATQEPYEGGSPERFLPAVILIAIGAMFLVDNLHLLPGRDVWAYVPVIFMVLGAFKMADAQTPNGRALGGLLVVGGGVALASNLNLIPFNVEDLWPLLLIGAGVYMLINRSGYSWGTRGNYTTRMQSEAAVFGGGKRKIVDPDFKYAKFDAVFGGFEIDLREAGIMGDSATININVVFGGAEVRIPSNWSAVVQAAGVFGGISDRSIQPNPSMPGVKRLFIKGAAVFGGVEIKN